MTQMHDWDIGSGKLRFSMCFLGMESHGDCHTHIDALNHVSYDGKLYGGRSVDTVKSKGAQVLDMDDYATGRHRARRPLRRAAPPRRQVARAGRGGRRAPSSRRSRRPRASASRRATSSCSAPATTAAGSSSGPWDNGYDGEGKAGLHVDTIPWMHERGIAAFLPDGDGETVPSTVDGMLYPIHPLQVTAMGMVVSDSLQLEDVAKACEEEGRWEFLVMCSPLRIQGGTGSPFNPIAVL